MLARIRRTVLWMLPFFAAAGCGGESSGTPPPAVVGHDVAEDELNTISLTAEAEQRLGIDTVVIERRTVTHTRELGGEVVVPFEREITVTSPEAGLVLAPSAGVIPATGSLVRRGDPILRMVFLPSGQDLSNARDQLAAAQARADAAKREAARADTLIRDRVITEREHEIATTNLAIAEAELRAARARNAVVRQGDEVADSAALGSMELSAPRDGVLWGVWVSAGQTVAASAPLFEVIDLDPAWIRVPVYAGDAAQVARGEAARVRPLGSDTRDAGRRASPAPAPPSASPLTASVDLYYEVRNADRAFRPQQRVTVAVPLQSSEEALVVPRTAVVYDINGGTWVYVRVREHVYSRQRIEVRSIAGDMAVLARGPAPGTVVVTNGAAELFGTEFGAAH